jgi:hypothetical protein
MKGSYSAGSESSSDSNYNNNLRVGISQLLSLTSSFVTADGIINNNTLLVPVISYIQSMVSFFSAASVQTELDHLMAR